MDNGGNLFQGTVISGNIFSNVSEITNTSATSLLFSNNRSVIGAGTGTPATHYIITPTSVAAFAIAPNGSTNILFDGYGSPQGSTCLGGGGNTMVYATRAFGVSTCYGAPGQTFSACVPEPSVQECLPAMYTRVTSILSGWR